MKTELVVAFRAAQKTRDAARRRDHELQAFCSGGTIVFAGFLMAVLYALLTHQIMPR